MKQQSKESRLERRIREQDERIAKRLGITVKQLEERRTRQIAAMHGKSSTYTYQPNPYRKASS